MRKAHIITELYYANVKIYVSREHDSSLGIESSKLKLFPRSHSESVLTYVFENTEVPFAMKLERVKHWEY